MLQFGSAGCRSGDYFGVLSGGKKRKMRETKVALALKSSFGPPNLSVCFGSVGGGTPYLPRCTRALRSGALEICINPAKGLYISSIKKTAAETDSAQRHRVAMTFPLRGAMRPKLQKIRPSQQTTVAPQVSSAVDL